MSTTITKDFVESLSEPHGDWDQKFHSECLKERNTILLIPDRWEGKKKITQELISLALKPLAGIFPTLVGREGKSWTASFNTKERAAKVLCDKIVIEDWDFKPVLYGVWAPRTASSRMILRVDGTPQWVTEGDMKLRFSEALSVRQLHVAIPQSKTEENDTLPLSCNWEIIFSDTFKVPKYITVCGRRCRAFDTKACWICAERGHSKNKCPLMTDNKKGKRRQNPLSPLEEEGATDVTSQQEPNDVQLEAEDDTASVQQQQQQQQQQQERSGSSSPRLINNNRFSILASEVMSNEKDDEIPVTPQPPRSSTPVIRGTLISPSLSAIGALEANTSFQSQSRLSPRTSDSDEDSETSSIDPLSLDTILPDREQVIRGELESLSWSELRALAKENQVQQKSKLKITDALTALILSKEQITVPIISPMHKSSKHSRSLVSTPGSAFGSFHQLPFTQRQSPAHKKRRGPENSLRSQISNKEDPVSPLAHRSASVESPLSSRSTAPLLEGADTSSRL